jgi:hypothetical protein
LDPWLLSSPKKLVLLLSLFPLLLAVLTPTFALNKVLAVLSPTQPWLSAPVTLDSPELSVPLIMPPLPAIKLLPLRPLLLMEKFSPLLPDSLQPMFNNLPLVPSH